MTARKFDTYLFDSLRTAASEGADALGLQFGIDPQASQRAALPMLICLRDPAKWQPPRAFHMMAAVGDVISGRGDLGDLLDLNKDPNVLSVEASRPAGSMECATSVPFIGTTALHDKRPAERGGKCLIAFIDSGIDVLHDAFLDSTGKKTRIVEIWDQRDETGPAPNKVYPGLSLNYGTLHRHADIQSYVASKTVPAALTRPLSGGDPREHGTHVASIAAGRATSAFAGGVAPDAAIMMVIPKMRTSPTDRFSIGYSSSHVEALHYIREAVIHYGKEAALEHALPVVVNVSAGMNAGAHDGTSLLERAFDNFTNNGGDPGRAIVKSAGNERQHAGHAKLRLTNNLVDAIKWSANPTIARHQDIVECWFDGADECRFRLIDPQGSASPVCDWTHHNITGILAGSSNHYALEYSRCHRDNGDSRLLVAIRRGQALDIAGGEWALQVEAVRVQSTGRELHAWLEREASRPTAMTAHSDEWMTISIPGTARTVITVGSVNSAFPISMTESSSYGPTRKGGEKPDLVAPGTGICAALAGSTDNVVQKTGTSMAAPHVAGAIALLFSQCAGRPGVEIPNASQVLAVLKRSTQNGTGHFSPTDGFGVLDASRLCAAF